MFILLLISCLQLSSSKNIHSKSYCSINANHVLCNEAKVDTNKCHKYIKTTELNRMDQQEILSVINNWRIERAEGKSGDKAFSGDNLVANMMKMQWDDELEKTASAISKRCEPYKSCKGCIDLQRFPSTFIEKVESFSEEPKKPFYWVPFLQKNVHQDDLSTHNKKQNPKDLRLISSSFDLMTWPEIYLMGCSFSIIRNEKKFDQKFVCTFGPVVPSRDKSAFVSGYPCTFCPLKSHCSTDDTLCECDNSCFPFEYKKSLRVRRAATTQINKPSLEDPGKIKNTAGGDSKGASNSGAESGATGDTTSKPVEKTSPGNKLDKAKNNDMGRVVVTPPPAGGGGGQPQQPKPKVTPNPAALKGVSSDPPGGRAERLISTGFACHVFFIFVILRFLA